MTAAVTFAEHDPSLTERLCRNDESALAAVYDRYANLVFAAARRIVIDPQAAKDVTQEVLVHLWRNAAIVTLASTVESRDNHQRVLAVDLVA